MRAIRCDGARVHFVADAPPPVPAAGESLVRIKRAGLTALDAAAPRRTLGFTGTIGAELIGTVEDSPPGAPPRASLIGRRVAAAGSVACAVCDLCRSGLSAHCRHRAVPGLIGREGYAAEFARVPTSSLVALPDALTDDLASLVWTAAIGAHAAQAARVESRAFATVIGDSAAAILTASILALTNPTTRLLVTSEQTAECCARLGLRHRPVSEAGRRQDQGVVVDFTGSAAGLRQALQFVRPRGTIVLAADGSPAPLPVGRPWPESTEPDGLWSGLADLGPLIAAEVRIIGCREGSLAEGVSLLERGLINASALVVRRWKPEDAAAALSAAKASSPEKHVIEF